MVKSTEEIQERSTLLHQQSIVVDMMNASVIPDEGREETYLQEMIKSGVTALNMCIAISDNFRQAIKKIGRWYAFIEKYSDVLTLGRRSSDIVRAKKEGKIAILFSFQNTTAIENDLSFLQIFKELGVTTMQVTYNERNLSGDGCGERTDCGLSDFGVEVVKEMNRRGIMIDLSHVGRTTTSDVLEFTEAPVIYTHTASYTLNPHTRNKTDEELRRVAATGGIVGVLSLGTFLKDKPESKITIEDFLDHVDHFRKTIGVDNIGFGLDLTENSKATDYPVHKGHVSSGWPWPYAKGLEMVSDIPNITKGLISRNYSEEEIQKILGGNFLRVYSKVVG